MKRKRKPIYVESHINASLDDVWNATQEPGRHQRWDVRFGSISYDDRVDGEPQRFTYATRVAPGVNIAGTGESLGERDRADGTRWSGLKFWAKDRRSIIDAGAGYWRYIPADDWQSGEYSFSIEIIVVDSQSGAETTLGSVASNDTITVP